MTSNKISANNKRATASDHHIHDKFFKKIYSYPEYAKDLFKLSFSTDELELFDLDNLQPAKEVISDDNNKELLFDLNYTAPLKNYPDCSVRFGIIVEHTTRMMKDTARRLNNYCVQDMSRTRGLTKGILFYQGYKPIDIPNNYTEFLLKDELPPEIIAKLLPYYPNFPFSIVSLPNIPDNALMSKRIISSPCLLAMKYIKQMTDEIMAMVLGCCHGLSSKNRKNLIQYLMSYIWRADKKYSEKEITAIETNYFPNLEEEKRVMYEDIPLGFEGDRQIARDQGRREGLAKGRTEGLAKGLAKGRDEGRTEGLAKGRTEGLAKGRTEGTRAERERLALSFLHAGVAVKIISNVTGIDEHDLKKLKKKFEQ